MSDLAKFKQGIITLSKEIAMPDGFVYTCLWSEEWTFAAGYVSSKNARVLIPVANVIGYARCSNPKAVDIYVIGEPK